MVNSFRREKSSDGGLHRTTLTEQARDATVRRLGQWKASSVPLPSDRGTKRTDEKDMHRTAREQGTADGHFGP
jgi:hypothetical protein